MAILKANCFVDLYGFTLPNAYCLITSIYWAKGGNIEVGLRYWAGEEAFQQNLQSWSKTIVIALDDSQNKEFIDRIRTVLYEHITNFDEQFAGGEKI